MHHNMRGFTLLETVIYIALFSILMSGVLVTLFQLLDAGTMNRTAVAVQEEGTFVNRKINWALAGATAVNVPNTKTLTITRPDLGAQSPLQITESAGEMRISRGGATPVPLTTSEFEVADTEISVIPPASGVPTAVRVSYTIEGTPFVFITYLRF